MTWALPQQEIDVVSAVWQEVTKYAPATLADLRLRQVNSSASVPALLANRHLDSGEEEAIAYALAQPAGTERLLLSDDYRVRLACQAFALPVIGSVGLIIEAYKAGRVSKELAEAALRDLPTRGRFYVKPTLIAQALNKLESG